MSLVKIILVYIHQSRGISAGATKLFSVQNSPSTSAQWSVLGPSDDHFQSFQIPFQSSKKKNQLLTYSEENPATQEGGFRAGFLEAVALNSACRFFNVWRMFTTDEWLCSAPTWEPWCSAVGQPATPGASASACCRMRSPSRCLTGRPNDGETERKHSSHAVKTLVA